MSNDDKKRSYQNWRGSGDKVPPVPDATKKIENVLVRIYNLLAITQVSIPITVLAMMLGKFKTKIRLTQKLFSPVTGGGIIVRFVS